MIKFGDITLHSGKKSWFKIECDPLNQDDWQAFDDVVTRMQQVVGSYRLAIGVPTGGVRFAEELNIRNEECMSDDPVLIVDDVWTTGDSWNAIAKPFLDNGIPVRGIVIFTRSGNLPPNVQALIYVQDLHEYLNT